MEEEMKVEELDGAASGLSDVLEELLRCPFCGSRAAFEYNDWNPETEEGDDGIGRVHCTNAKCDVGFVDDYESAIEKWNARSNASANGPGGSLPGPA